MKYVYRIRDKYLYNDMVQLASERSCENLLISRHGLHFLEKNGRIINNYEKPIDANIPFSDQALTDDYYLNFLPLGSPVIRFKSTERARNYADEVLKDRTVSERIAFRPLLSNYEILVEGVSVNGDDPIVGDEGDIIGIIRSISTLDRIKFCIDYNDSEKLNKFCDSLYSSDEQYILSETKGILSIVIDGEKLVDTGFDFKEIVGKCALNAKKINQVENGYNGRVYFISIDRDKSMNINLVSFEDDKLCYAPIFPDSVFLSEEKVLMGGYLGSPKNYIKRGSWDLLTFDNDDLDNIEYNEDLKEGLVKKIGRFFSKK